MKNFLLNRKHLVEYVIYGLIGTVLYSIFLLIFLADHKYENFYLLFIGNFLFVAVMGFYTYTLINRPFEGKRTVSMLIAGHMALVAGIVMSALVVLICGLIYFPGIFSAVHPDEIIPGAPTNVDVMRPSGLIFMLEANVILVSGGSASFLIVVFAYVAKRNQTRDKPTSLETYVNKP